MESVQIQYANYMAEIDSKNFWKFNFKKTWVERDSFSKVRKT
jgi:hypothetical protein